MKCLKCGSEYPDNVMVCPTCGIQSVQQPIQQPVQQPIQQPVQQPVQQPIHDNMVNTVNQTNPNMPIESGLKKRSNSLYLAILALFICLFFNVWIGLVLAVVSFIVLFTEKNKIDSKSFKKALIINIITFVIVIAWIAFIILFAKYAVQ